MLLVFTVLGLLHGIVSLLACRRSARYVRTFRPRRASHESVLVLCPCKGVDPEFAANVRSILSQDHPNFRVQFVVESELDPAYGVLVTLGAAVLVAGVSAKRGQKVHNLVTAIEQAPPVDVFVFCDSDTQYPPHWLSTLIAPLDATHVTTGYRWYLAERFHFATLMRSSWNAVSADVFSDHGRNICWGGSTAIRRDTFERLAILDAWSGALTDDFSLTRAALDGGASIVFVPEGLLPSLGECSLGELLEFTTRQLVITRVYYPRLWLAGLVFHGVFNLAFWSLALMGSSVALLLYALEATKMWIRLTAAHTAMQDRRVRRYLWFYVIVAPLTELHYLYVLLASAMTTEIVWRGVRYRLVSPTETLVFREPRTAR